MKRLDVNTAVKRLRMCERWNDQVAHELQTTTQASQLRCLSNPFFGKLKTEPYINRIPILDRGIFLIRV